MGPSHQASPEYENLAHLTLLLVRMVSMDTPRVMKLTRHLSGRVGKGPRLTVQKLLDALPLEVGNVLEGHRDATFPFTLVLAANSDQRRHGYILLPAN